MKPALQTALDFRGKVVVVTGSSRGIGAGIARRFAECGAAVVLNCVHSLEAAHAVAAQIADAGGTAHVVPADVSRADGAERLIEAAVTGYGRLDVLVNNAGLYPLRALIDMSEDEWDRVVDANLKGTFLCTRQAARALIAQGEGGAIVNITSIEAVNPAPFHAHYNAAKAGQEMLTRTAALELGRHGIRVNAVAPGLIGRAGLDEEWPEGVQRWLDRVPLGRLGRPEDVADACLFLASPLARWITGVTLTVDGGVLTNQIF